MKKEKTRHGTIKENRSINFDETIMYLRFYQFL